MGDNYICCPSAVCFTSKRLVSIWANVQFTQASSRVYTTLSASCEISSKRIFSLPTLIGFESLKIKSMGNNMLQLVPLWTKKFIVRHNFPLVIKLLPWKTVIHCLISHRTVCANLSEQPWDFARKPGDVGLQYDCHNEKQNLLGCTLSAGDQQWVEFGNVSPTLPSPSKKYSSVSWERKEPWVGDAPSKHTSSLNSNSRKKMAVMIIVAEDNE